MQYKGGLKYPATQITIQLCKQTHASVQMPSHLGIWYVTPYDFERQVHKLLHMPFGNIITNNIVSPFHEFRKSSYNSLVLRHVVASSIVHAYFCNSWHWVHLNSVSRCLYAYRRQFYKEFMSSNVNLIKKTLWHSHNPQWSQNSKQSTTVELLWHVQMCYLIGSLNLTLQQTEFSQYFNNEPVHI